MNTFLRFLLLAGGLAVASIPAGAQTTVVFNTFGAGDIYNTEAASTLTGSANSVGVPVYAQAAAFTPSSGGYLSSLELPLNVYDSMPVVDVSLWSDAGGAPGAVLQSWSGFSFSEPNIYSFAATGAPVQLVSGSSYWVVANAATSTTWAGWFKPDAAAAIPGQPAFYSENGGPFNNPNSAGAFRVTVSAIPEPSTYAALFGAAALGLVVWRRRVKR